MLNYRFINHRNIYLFGLVLLGIGLPVSVFLMSIAQFILAINWILEGRFNRKLEILLNRPSIWVFVSVFLLHVLGLLWTEWPLGFMGSGYNGLKDLRLKLPMLLLPVIVGTSSPLSFKELKAVIYFFSASVLVSTLISFVVFLGWTNRPVNSARDLSLFISHIRFALLVNVSIFALLFFVLHKKEIPSRLEKTISLFVVTWFIFFFVILQSATGITIFIFSSAVLGLGAIRIIPGVMWRFMALAIFVAGLLVVVSFLAKSFDRFYTIRQPDFRNPDSLTINGRPYLHHFEDKRMENGWFISQYLCEEELIAAWNQKGSIPFDGADGRGQGLKFTLIRYLTSKGLRKDSVGVSQLTTQDVTLIEDGYANCIYLNRFSLYPRLYEVLWEVDDYRNGGNPSGHSVTQRIEYFHTGLAIVRDHFWIGVGTGDVKSAFDKKYQELNSSLSPEYRHRAHNQWLTFFIAFGFIGFLFIALALLYPFIKEGKSRDYLFMMFFMIAMVSMMNEDTLETQPGVTFFTFFYVLFLFARRPSCRRKRTSVSG